VQEVCERIFICNCHAKEGLANLRQSWEDVLAYTSIKFPNEEIRRDLQSNKCIRAKISRPSKPESHQ